MYKALCVGLLTAAMLAGCAAAPVGQVTPTAPPTVTLAQSPAEAEAPSPVPTLAPPTATPEQAPPTDTPAPAPTDTPSPTAAPPSAAPAPASEPEILFLRGGDLMAYGLRSRAERTVASGVRSFAAASDGQLLAMLRGDGRSGEIWVARRDGADLRQITSNERAEWGLSWAPDGSALAYSSATIDGPPALDWAGWGGWCAAAEVRVIELGDMQERSLAPGCDPAFGPDGKRIAFASAPQSQAEGQAFRGATNTVRLVNRQGQNGWSFATANGESPADQGYAVYAPAWSPSGEQVAYQRFLGYRTLVDINITEIGAAFKGDGRPLASGAGWMLPPQFAPGGRAAALLEHNFSDARGGSGYEIWRLTLVQLGVESSMALPSGEVPTVGKVAWQAPRVTAAAWAPDGEQLALALPAGWSVDDPAQDLLYQAEGAGEVWLWGADGRPQERLIAEVDYASPLLWLPA
jgi:hypothetical protein